MAILVPCRLRAMQHSAPSWAGISTGGFSVLARSTICTCPEWVPGNASRELLLLGQSTHRPGGGGRGVMDIVMKRERERQREQKRERKGEEQKRECVNGYTLQPCNTLVRVVCLHQL